MAGKETVRRYDISEEELDLALANAIGAEVALDDIIGTKTGAVEAESLVQATVLAIQEDRERVLVDIGGKAEAPISLALKYPPSWEL